jgi:hypothetical protein
MCSGWGIIFSATSRDFGYGYEAVRIRVKVSCFFIDAATRSTFRRTWRHRQKATVGLFCPRAEPQLLHQMPPGKWVKVLSGKLRGICQVFGSNPAPQPFFSQKYNCQNSWCCGNLSLEEKIINKITTTNNKNKTNNLLCNKKRDYSKKNCKFQMPILKCFLFYIF